MGINVLNPLKGRAYVNETHNNGMHPTPVSVSLINVVVGRGR